MRRMTRVPCPIAYRRRRRLARPPLPCPIPEVPAVEAPLGARAVHRRGRSRSPRRRIFPAASPEEVCATTGERGPHVLKPDSGSRQTIESATSTPRRRPRDSGRRRRRGRPVLAGTVDALTHFRAVADLACRADAYLGTPAIPARHPVSIRPCPLSHRPRATQKTRGPGLGPHCGLQALSVRQSLER